MTVTFGYDPVLFERFPALTTGVIGASGLSNGPTPQELTDEYGAAQAEVAARLADEPIAEIPSITAWRRAFTACGVKPTQHRVAAEALLRRLHKQGDVPSINTLVDLANLVSIRYAMPVAVFDQAEVTGATTVRLAKGDERFTDLGAADPVPPELDEVIFVDESGIVSARRWCWRQSAQSATGPSTTDALITIEGLHESAKSDIVAALDDLHLLLARFQPQASFSAQLLDSSTQVVTFETH